MGVGRGDGAPARRPVDDAPRGVRLAEVDEPADRVQRVRELVLLRAQALGEALRPRQAPQGVVDLGAIHEDDRCAGPAPVELDRRRAGEQHALAREDQALRIRPVIAGEREQLLQVGPEHVFAAPADDRLGRCQA